MKRAVVDQPGLKSLFFGFVSALFIGLVLKSQIRPVVIEKKIRDSIKKVDSKLNLDFESAEIKLSEWGIPRPILYVYGVRINPQLEICRDSQVYIEDVSFPINWSILFSDKKIISNLHLSLVEVRSSQFSECLKKIQTSQNHSNIFSDVSNNQDQSEFNEKLEVTENYKKHDIKNEKIGLESNLKMNIDAKKTDSFLLESNSQRSLLKEIRIDKLKWISLDHINSNFDLSALQINLKYDGVKVSEVELQSQLHAFRDLQKKFNLLKSEVKMQIQIENKLFSINSDISGFLLDRPFKLKFKKELQNQLLDFYGELNQLPVKTLNTILQQQISEIQIYDALSGMAFNAALFGQWDMLKHHFKLSINNLKLVNSEYGSLESSNVKISLTDKLKIEPFEVHLNQINLTPFLKFKFFEKIRPSIHNAGVISGLLQFEDLNNFKLKTLVEHSSFIFSNLGQRVGQQIDSYNLSAIVKNEKAHLIIDDFILDSQKLFGYIKYTHHFEKNMRELQVQLSGKLLKPETVKLFTGYEFTPMVKLELKSDLSKGFTANGEISQFQYDQFNLENIKFNFIKSKNLNDEITDSIHILAKSATVDRTKKTQIHIFDTLDENIYQNNVLILSQLKINFIKNFSKGGSWSAYSVVENSLPGSRISSEGNFNLENQYQGNILFLNSKNKINKKLSNIK